ncbi:hypothetical protein BH09DEP1_BH09DEP1_8100 [soil metagenome]
MLKNKLFLLTVFIVIPAHPVLTFEQFAKLSGEQKWQMYQADMEKQNALLKTKTDYIVKLESEADAFPIKTAIGSALAGAVAMFMLCSLVEE